MVVLKVDMTAAHLVVKMVMKMVVHSVDEWAASMELSSAVSRVG